ncbi:winged helix-turn-helix domain-containing protein [Eleftheria terrae]|uniref:winged helix-turn-helix domain-containing protein n=1 Tax=Eleftheria terrae TaxID=1597781 RepID=UPI00263AF816|nr:winged helix-turn-helix domain-containing protein [Eleftheria terrae]WKB52688.1 winged helix-turn-helix domain-containing protein [Eleftheria terrae]
MSQEPESPAPPAELRLRIRVTRGEDIAIGPGKIALLEAIREHGSITLAARQIGMSYRRAWMLLDEVNRSLRRPATTSAQGGQRGGGSVLTAEGETVVRLYREIERQAEQACAAQITALLAMVGDPE